MSRQIASLVLLTYNNLEKTTKPCLDSLFNCKNEFEFELIIVDNGSSDNTPSFLQEIKKKHDKVTLLLNKRNLGYAAGMNIGINKSKGKYIFLLNNDLLFTDNWIDKIVATLKANKKIGLIGPITNSAGNEQKVHFDGISKKNFKIITLEYTKKNFNIFTPTHRLGFFCVAFRRDFFWKVGLLDENFGIGMFEDDDYCLRSEKKGFNNVIVDHCFVYHLGSASFKLLNKNKYNGIFASNKKYFEKKHSTEWSFNKIINAYIHYFNYQTFKGDPEYIDRVSRRLKDFNFLLHHEKNKVRFFLNFFNSVLKRLQRYI